MYIETESAGILALKCVDSGTLLSVGVTRFELATTRPPDAYSNRAELHPESGLIKTNQYRF